MTAIEWPAYMQQLATELGGRLVSWRPQTRNSGGRAAFFVRIDQHGTTRDLYVRAGRDLVPDDRAFADLSSEKTVMDWLDARGIPIAAAVHLSKAPAALVMTALSGRDDFLEINTTEEGESVLAHYIDILAEMHAHDVTGLAAAGFRAPEPGPRVPLDHFESFALSLHREGVIPRNPLCTWVDRWMVAHAPAYHGPLSLVQGDTGPGNFVYADGRVQGLVDWELAHLGDPMEDLGALRLRDIWTPFPGGISACFDRYRKQSGRDIDLDAVRWYSIKLCMVHPFVLSIPYH